MFPDISAPIIVLLALVPAAVRLWRDRATVQLLDDATLPERLLARGKQQQVLFGTCCAAIALARTDAALWAVPLLIAANVAAAFPFRKRLLGETWALPAYLAFAGRMTTAKFGFWSLLAFAPALGGIFHTPPWLVPAALAAGLLVWNERHPEVFRSLMRARPISDPALLARVEALARRSTAPMPRLECADLRGGVLANAYALPSEREASVIVTDTVLARLEPDEVVAVCAHEIAHLEYYDRRRVRSLTMVSRLLVIAAGVLVPLTATAGPVLSTVLWCLWPLAIVAALIWRGKDRQRNETVSDTRAIELTGNAEALASALSKIYATNHIPRRWDQQFEQRSTHPSLARRIRDIRAAAGVAPVVPSTSTSVTAAGGGAGVVFEPTKLRWIEGDVEHSISYSGLTELRVDARASGATKLIAVDRAGRRWQMPLETSDAARVQSVLDTVDGQLAHAAHAASIAGATAARVTMVLAAFLCVSLGQFAAAILAILAATWRAAPLVAASGTGCLVAALLAWRDGAGVFASNTPFLAIAGAALLWIAYTRRKEPAGPAGRPIAIVGVLAAIAVVLVLTSGIDPIRLHQSSRALPAASVATAALATALATLRGRANRAGAAAAAGISLLLVSAGSMTFLERVGRDPLLVAVDDLRATPIDGAPVMEFALPFIASDLALSPHARSYIAEMDEDEDEDAQGNARARVVRIGRVGEAPVTVRADEAVFADEDHVLTARFTEAGVELREVGLDASTPELWRTQVGGMGSSWLSADPKTGRWRLLGRDRDRHIARAEGTIGRSDLAWTRWSSVDDRRLTRGTSATADEAVAVEKHYELGPFGGTLVQAFAPLLFAPHSESRLWRATAGAPAIQAALSRLDTDCIDGALDGRLVCAVFDGVRTRIAAIDPASGQITPIVGLRGQFITFGSRVVNGWIYGWNDANPLALNVAARKALVMPRGRGAYVRALAVADRVVAAVSMQGTTSRVRLYRLPGW